MTEMLDLSAISHTLERNDVHKARRDRLRISGRAYHRGLAADLSIVLAVIEVNGLR